MFWFQFADHEERMHQLEFEIEDLQGDIQRRHKQMCDLQDNMNDMKVDLASIREQKTSAENEVGFLMLSSYQSGYH